MNEVPALDGLRAIAVLLVMLLHFELLALGWIGVQFFFVLSGFLISANLLASSSRLPKGTAFRLFYVKRTLRIFPLYYLALGGFYLFEASPLFPQVYAPGTAATEHGYLSHALFLQNFASSLWGGAPLIRPLSHFWSLAVEEQFYLFFPFLLLFLGRSWMLALSAASLLVCPLLRAWGGDIWVYKNTILQADAFGMGILLSLLWERESFRERARSWVSKVNLALGAYLGALLVGGFFLLKGYRSINYPVSNSSFGFEVSTYLYSYVWVFSAYDLLGALLVLFCLLNPGNRFLALPAMRYLGRISFGLYVYHYPIALAFNQNFNYQAKSAKGLAFFTAYFCLTVAAATASYHLWEKRFLKLKELYSAFTQRSSVASI